MNKKRESLNNQTLRIFWQHAKAYPLMVSLCLVGIILVIGCDLSSTLIYKRFFDLLARYITVKDPRILGEINITIGLVGLVALGSWIGWRLSMRTITIFESHAMADLTNHSFEYLHKHSYRFFTNSFAGSLVKRVNRFSAGFEVVADQCSIQLGQTALRICLIIGILFWRNKTLGFVFLVWTIVFVAFNVLYSRYKLKFDLYRAEMDTKVTARLSDTISNNINLKLFAGVEREISDFKELVEEHRLARYTSWMLAERSDYIQGLSVRALEILILVLAVHYWIKGALTIGDFLLLRSYLYQLVDKVREVGNSVRRIYEAMADANEMTEILLTKHEISDVPSSPSIVVKKGEIQFKNVKFRYATDSNMVLKNFNLSTIPGERIGIVGPSGGGKSTILKLLVRLYDVTEGEILIDNQNITRVTQSSLHRKIAYVPQDPILFHRTLMENIRYSRREASDEEVIQAAKLAHCHEFISTFPLGYETLVGERGVKLSGGERQRVAIARAILMDAPILVLDEATSSLDSESESYIQDALSRLMIGRTVIAVAHRFSTIRKMDRIVVVKDGRIVEQGNHDLLVEIEDGLYQKLWDLQSTH